MKKLILFIILLISLGCKTQPTQRLKAPHRELAPPSIPPMSPTGWCTSILWNFQGENINLSFTVQATNGQTMSLQWTTNISCCWTDIFTTQYTNGPTDWIHCVSGCPTNPYSASFYRLRFH